MRRFASAGGTEDAGPRASASSTWWRGMVGGGSFSSSAHHDQWSTIRITRLGRETWSSSRQHPAPSGRPRAGLVRGARSHAVARVLLQPRSGLRCPGLEKNLKRSTRKPKGGTLLCAHRPPPRPTTPKCTPCHSQSLASRSSSCTSPAVEILSWWCLAPFTRRHTVCWKQVTWDPEA
mgnify:FL=1